MTDIKLKLILPLYSSSKQEKKNEKTLNPLKPNTHHAYHPSWYNECILYRQLIFLTLIIFIFTYN